MTPCIGDANAVQLLWRLNPSDGSWLKGLVGIVLPDVVEDELNGRGYRKEFLGRSAPGKAALAHLRGWDIIAPKPFVLEFTDALRATGLIESHNIDTGEAFAIVLAASHNLPVLTEDAAGRRAAADLLGPKRVLSVLDLLWWAVKHSRIDRTWVDSACGRLTPHFKGADAWPVKLKQYAQASALSW